MDLGGILILLLLLVSLIVFIYVLVITARGWGVLHTLLLSLLFIECWVFIVFSAGVQYRRVNATKLAHENRLKAEAALARTKELLWGDYGTSPDAQEAVVPVQGMLRRLTADRGRVWRQLILLQSDPDSYQLELRGGIAAAGDDADVLAEEPAPAATNVQATSESLPVNTVVYAFAEDLDDEGHAIPNYYLGEFTVTQSQAGQVTLKPTLQLYADQQQRIESGGALTWMLYELMPLDSHQAFVAANSQPSQEDVFGRMDEDALGILFANIPDVGNRRQQLIDSYLRDGQRASDDDPAEHVWVQVNVLKDYEIDVDSKEIANATERGYFDSLGRSIDSRLKRGEEGTVKLTPDMKDKRIILKEEVARPLIDNGIVELIQRVYIRPLNDYEEAFNHHVVRDHEVSQSLVLTQRDSDEIQKANQLGQEMINFRQIENQQLRSDLSNYQKEIEALNAAVAAASQEYQELESELGRLTRTVLAR